MSDAARLYRASLDATEGWDQFDYAERAHESEPGNVDYLLHYLDLASHLPTLVVRVTDNLPDALAADERVASHRKAALAKLA